MDFLLHLLINALVYNHFHLLSVITTLSILSIFGHVMSHLTKSFHFLSFCSNSDLHVKTFVFSLQQAYRTIN